MTDDETRVLDRGLKFAPIRNMNKFQTYVNVQKYTRSLNMKKYFLSNPIERNSSGITPGHSNLRNRSTFNPQYTDTRHLDVFRNMVCKDLESLNIKRVKDSQCIKRGILSLEKRNDIVIRPADKGGGLLCSVRLIISRR